MNDKRNKSNNVIVLDNSLIQKKIQLIRNEQIMIDSDLAELFGVETKRLNESDKRNIYDDLKNIIDFFISFSETILINSAFSNLGSYPFTIRLEARNEEEINLLCPIIYVLYAEIGDNKNVKVGNQIGYENNFDKKLL